MIQKSKNAYICPVLVHQSGHPKVIGKAGVAQLVERQPSKLRVASSSLVSRSSRSTSQKVGAFLLDTI
jgi:hypothetical protein